MGLLGLQNHKSEFLFYSLYISSLLVSLKNLNTSTNCFASPPLILFPNCSMLFPQGIWIIPLKVHSPLFQQSSKQNSTSPPQVFVWFFHSPHCYSRPLLFMRFLTLTSNSVHTSSDSQTTTTTFWKWSPQVYPISYPPTPRRTLNLSSFSPNLKGAIKNSSITAVILAHLIIMSSLLSFVFNLFLM